MENITTIAISTFRVLQSSTTVDQLQLASRMRLADMNFMPFVLNRNITKIIKHILNKYVISCLNLFSVYRCILKR